MWHRGPDRPAAQNKGDGTRSRDRVQGVERLSNAAPRRGIVHSSSQPLAFIAFMDTSTATAQDHLIKAVEDEIKMSQRVTQELIYRRNALVPISRLPPETLVEIFSLLPFATDDSKYVLHLARIHVTHVCHRWREIALCFPYLWNHIHFTKLTLAGITEILARAKMSPLHFEGEITPTSKAQFSALGRQLEAHISHTRHLTLSGEFQTVFGRLKSPAPTLVSLSLTMSCRPYRSSQCIIPDSLFNGTAPKLTRLELLGCSIGWKSPLLKGLRNLKIQTPSAEEMPTLEDWLTALNEMSQLKTLILEYATPDNPVDYPHIPELQRTVTLPYSLQHLCGSGRLCPCTRTSRVACSHFAARDRLISMG